MIEQDATMVIIEKPSMVIVAAKRTAAIELAEAQLLAQMRCLQLQ